VSVPLFENKPERCPLGHLWPGKAQVSWTPCICDRPGKRPGVAAAWDTSESHATAATTTSGRQCSSSHRTTAGTGPLPAGWRGERPDRGRDTDRRAAARGSPPHLAAVADIVHHEDMWQLCS